MNVEIRRTTVTPTEDGSVVQLHISDALPEAPFASIDLQITVSLPRYAQAILIAQAQRQAMQVAQKVLTEHLSALAPEIQALVQLNPPVLEAD